MVKTLLIDNSNHSQSMIHIGSGAIKRIELLINLEGYSKIILIYDANVPEDIISNIRVHIGDKVTALPIKSTEKNKNLSTVQLIWDYLIKEKADRKSLLIVLGGGVLTDLGGFAASTYMRGINYINVPSTLLSQVDASVGGKNGFNYLGIKNLIGLFNQPKSIIIDPSILTSLSKREYISGFAEILKHGLIYDEKYFKFVTSKRPLEFNSNELCEIIARSCEIKMDIIKSDLNETDHRKLVNYGHTVGHAIESLSQSTPYPLLHGEAVSIGMMAEALMAEAIGLLKSETVEVIKSVLQSAELPIAFDSLDVHQIVELMRADKKNEKQKINFTLLDKIGHAKIDQYIPEDVIIEVLRTLDGAQT